MNDWFENGYLASRYSFIKLSNNQRWSYARSVSIYLIVFHASFCSLQIRVFRATNWMLLWAGRGRCIGAKVAHFKFSLFDADTRPGLLLI